MVGDGNCDTECLFASCEYDAGDCATTKCGAACHHNTWIGNRQCDTGCRIEECNWDDGDCDRTPRGALYAAGLNWSDSNDRSFYCD